LAFPCPYQDLNSADGITSIPLTESLVLPLYKPFGEKRRAGCEQTQSKKLATKAILSTPKKKKVTTKLRLH
tara:strand:- start:907 stop:1119 length:213 start_codon:yes stop_codon:yes gene_type:complete